MISTAEAPKDILQKPDDRLSGTATPFYHTAHTASSKVRTIEQLEYQQVVSCGSSTPIHEAASLMSQQKVNCLFIKNDQEHIVGYVTDTTLGIQVVAQQVDIQRPVMQVMHHSLAAIDRLSTVEKALRLMVRTRSKFLLVEDEGQHIGVICRHKLWKTQPPSPQALMSSLRKATSVEDLKKIWERVPDMIFHLLDKGTKAERINQFVTATSDTMVKKVMEAVIEEMGTPPARFAFMALGSEGRQEQTLKTDQDNAIIYEDKVQEQRHEVRAYFLELADRVAERLNHIGFSYCTGGFMAKNPRWTHSLSHWKSNYAQWIHASTPETVMNFSTFFDCRLLYGDTLLMDELRDFLKQALQAPLEKFFFHMASNALQYEPPLNFFKNIRTFTVGSRQVFNLKKAMTPIVDLVRVYALKNRIFETNTGARLQALTSKGIFSAQECQELMQSYYYLMHLRLKKQAAQIISEGTAPDNYLEPGSLSKIEQATVKEIFRTIEKFQLKIKVGFTRTIF